MSSIFRTLAPVGAIVFLIGCGATTREPAPTTAPPSGPVQVNPSARGVIPVGQELDVRLQSTLSSETSTVEQRFEATTLVDLTQDGRVCQVRVGEPDKARPTDALWRDRRLRGNGGVVVYGRHVARRLVVCGRGGGLHRRLQGRGRGWRRRRRGVPRRLTASEEPIDEAR